MIDQTYSRPLREKIAQWESDFAMWAASRGLVSLTEWIRVNGAPSSSPEIAAAFAAQRQCNIEMAKTLRAEYTTTNPYPVK